MRPGSRAKSGRITLPNTLRLLAALFDTQLPFNFNFVSCRDRDAASYKTTELIWIANLWRS
jgi:hypothetical protein